jgi:hypothetical protein
MSHALQCQCGKVKGLVEHPEQANHAICYCRDCQAFAHFLGQADTVLDERYGSRIVQVLPSNVSIHSGREHLACMRLTSKGLLRWYTSCCHTALGNTMMSPKLAFLGVVHTSLAGGSQAIEKTFGPVRCVVNGESAKGLPKPKTEGIGRVLWWFLSGVLPARISGRYRINPLFNADTSEPVAKPRVLDAEEHAQLMAKVDAARSQGN